VKSKLSYKRQVTQGEAQARQNARSPACVTQSGRDRVCLDFSFLPDWPRSGGGYFLCIKAKKVTIPIKKK